MANGLPPNQSRPGQHDNLFDFGSQPVYSTGQRPPVDDTQLLQQYDIDDSDIQQRPSTSYDDFVGARPQTNPNTTNVAQSSTRAPFSPPYIDGGNRTYSQTSDLNNFQRYGDEDFPEDDPSTQKYYDMEGPSDKYIPGGGVHVVGNAHSRNRNSLMSLGGNFVGRAKSILGMQPEYSEMDLPLTETVVRSSIAGTDGLEDPHIAPEKKPFSIDNFKFGFGRRKVDPASLGPRIIYLNNSPTNAVNRWVDNHVSTAKYNIATFLPKF